jgi:membrane protein required for colicin V production
MSFSLDALNAVDAALLGLWGLSVLIGLLRGLMFEVMSLAGWLVAYAAAYLYSPVVLRWLPAEAGQGGSGALVTPGGLPLLAFVLTFFAVLIAWGLLAQLLRVLLRATPLSGIDRVLGAVFGLVRGGLLLLVVAAVVALTPWARTPAWQAALTVPWLHAGLDTIEPLLPPGVARWIAR